MLTHLYLQTTNPKLTFQQFIGLLVPILGSILLHTFLYIAFFNLASYIFLHKTLPHATNHRLVISLFAIMTVGFVARFLHVKEIYAAYNNDISKTRAHIDQRFNTWFFLS